MFALINLALLTGHVGPLRLRPGAAARAEQRAGRRRHGRHPGQAARRLRPRRRRGPRPATRRPGACRSRPKPGMHLSQMFDAMNDGHAAGAVLHRGEPGRVRGQRHARPAPAGGPRPPGRAGHLPHRDGRPRRRRAARGGRLVRVRGHGHQLRAPGAARPQGDRPAGAGPRRTPTSSAGSPTGWATPGASRRPRRCGTSCASLSLNWHHGMSYAPARRARRPAVAVPGRGPPRHAAAARPAVGAPTRPSGARLRRSRRSSTCRRWTRSPTSSRSGSPPSGCSTATTPACRPAGTPRRCAAGSRCGWTPPTAAKLGIADGERVRVVSRRGAVEAPVPFDPSLRPGLRRSRRTSPRRSTSTC